MSEIEPGQTATGARGVSQQFDMMSAREVAYLTLQQNPPPISVGWRIPCSKEQEDEAAQLYYENVLVELKQLWDTRIDSLREQLGVTPARLAETFFAHEPLYWPAWRNEQYKLMQALQQQAQIPPEQLAMSGQPLLDPMMVEAQIQQLRFDPMLQGPVPNPWLQAQMVTCTYQLHKDLLVYADWRARRERAVA